MTLVVGITGGIGSGKSAVTERFQRRGITVVDADLAARDYFIARDDGGALVWIYRTRLAEPGGWFLQGRFG